MLWQNILAILSVLAGPLLYLTGAVVIAVVGIALTRFLGALTRLANARAEQLARTESLARAQKLDHAELQESELSSTPEAS